MAGFSRMFLIGSSGGFMGSDGINSIGVQILQGEGGRQWLEVNYVSDQIETLGDIEVIVPEGPNHPNRLLDACIAFYPKAFENCMHFEKVKSKLKGVKKLDFDLGKNIPEEWYALREEAVEIFKSLHIYEAPLKRLNLDDFSLE